jgi:hypothetical protein
MLLEPEMERRRSPLVSIPPFGSGSSTYRGEVNSQRIIEKDYAKWTARRQAQIADLLARIWHVGKKPSTSDESKGLRLVDGMGFEPTTPALRTPCSPS